MSPSELIEFHHSPCAQAALQVRRWDDAAKDPTWCGLEFGSFRPLLERLLQPAGEPQ